MNSYLCEFCDKGFSTKYKLRRHSRVGHSVKMTSEINQVKRNAAEDEPVEFEESDMITERDLKEALDEAEFDQMVAREFDEERIVGTKLDEEDMKIKGEFEQRLKSFVERILVLAKDKALLKLKIKRVQEAQR